MICPLTTNTTYLSDKTDNIYTITTYFANVNTHNVYNRNARESKEFVKYEDAMKYIEEYDKELEKENKNER